MSRLAKRFGSAQPFAQRASAAEAANTRGLDQMFKRALTSGRLNLSGRELTRAPLARFLEVASGGVEGVSFWEVVDLRVLDLSHNALRHDTGDLEELRNLASLETLNLQHNPLGRLPEGVLALRTLKSLDVSCCELCEALPAALADLSDNLVSVAASGNGLVSVDAALCGLARLQVLNLSQNLIAALPPRGPYPAALLVLDLSSNQLTELPHDFCLECGGTLESLDVSGNRLTALPASVAALTRLKTLSVRENALAGTLTALPRSQVLHTLMLGRNKLRAIADGEGVDSLFAHMPQLCVLDVSENQLSALPDGVAACGQLKTLDVSMNNLTTLPVGLGYIASLTRVALDGNVMRSIRPAVRNAGAEKLKAFLRSRGGPHRALPRRDMVASEDTVGDSPVDAGLAAGPVGGGRSLADLVIAQCRKAHGISSTLDLAGMGIPAAALEDGQSAVFAAIKKTLGGTAGVRALILDRNGLGSMLPTRLAEMVVSATMPPGSLPALAKLSLEDNHLQALPTVLAQARLTDLVCHQNLLSARAVADVLGSGGSGLGGSSPLSHALLRLDLRRNRLNAVPEEVFQCAGLEVLLLSGNTLSDTSRCPWERLQALQELGLSTCGLHDAPETLHRLTALHVLDLSNNALTGLPTTLALSPSLKALRVEGNTLRSIRYDVVRGGTERILRYLGNKFPEVDQPAIERALEARQFGTRSSVGDGGGAGKRSGGSTGGSASTAEIVQLDAEIAKLEADAAATGGRLSKAQQYAANKKVKMLRAKRIRAQRAADKAAAAR